MSTQHFFIRGPYRLLCGVWFNRHRHVDSTISHTNYKVNLMKRIFVHATKLAVCGAFVLGMTAVSESASAAVLAYAANQRDGTVSVINTAQDKVIRTLPEHGKIGNKIQAVVVVPNSKTIYVVDADGDDLVAVNSVTGKIEKHIPVGKAPEGASLSPSGKMIAVCVEESNEVTLVDVASEKVVKKIHTQGKNPEHCSFSPDGRWLMTSNENSNNVDIIDLKLDKSVALVPTSGHPRGIAWLPHKPFAYVVQETAGGADIVDVPKHKVIDTIHTGVRPAGAIMGLRGKYVFISDGGSANVAAIDLKTHKVAGTMPVGQRPWNMALTPDGKKLYVANGRSNSVSVLDAVTLKHIKDIPVGKLPWGVTI